MCRFRLLNVRTFGRCSALPSRAGVPANGVEGATSGLRAEVGKPPFRLSEGAATNAHEWPSQCTLTLVYAQLYFSLKNSLICICFRLS